MFLKMWLIIDHENIATRAVCLYSIMNISLFLTYVVALKYSDIDKISQAACLLYGIFVKGRQALQAKDGDQGIYILCGAYIYVHLYGDWHS